MEKQVNYNNLNRCGFKHAYQIRTTAKGSMQFMLRTFDSSDNIIFLAYNGYYKNVIGEIAIWYKNEFDKHVTVSEKTYITTVKELKNVIETMMINYDIKISFLISPDIWEELSLYRFQLYHFRNSFEIPLDLNDNIIYLELSINNSVYEMYLLNYIILNNNLLQGTLYNLSNLNDVRIVTGVLTNNIATINLLL